MAENSFGWDNWTGTGVNDADSLAAEIDRIKKWQRTHSGIDFAAAGPDYPHPSQKVRALYFFEGNGRLDPTGIQIIADEASLGRGIFWVPAYSETPITVEPSVNLSGFIEATDAYFELGSTVSNFDYAVLAGDTTTNDSAMTISARSGAQLGGITVYVSEDFSANYVQIRSSPLWLNSTTADHTTALYDGMLWYRSDTDKFRARANGVTENLAFESSIPTTMNKQPFAAKTTTYTTTASDGVISVDATTASFTVTLVTAVGNAGLTQTFKKINATNVVTLDPNSSQTIDGALTYALSAQWSWVTLVSTGSAWIITGQG